MPIRTRGEESEGREDMVIQESGKGSGENQERYFGPTADYLGSLKIDETKVVVPPPRYNKVLRIYLQFKHCIAVAHAP